ncbi:uncharacterized protein LAESUDRAFT_726023 [Laetiporus sulphureus 93-53]|uniref:Autophagy-related protein 14 n=1 Tax=Laetiporus sulphureus 93-53 TaxID=1314785 RepID=A0A165E404_9APHY|nr:uncharacterized protein LAESUDRAFT_726023 [Laetiporus sulphureus 93-53]KZT06207.1 hypothetical protein LAESUDRAFT_726023 [Laetiporus sulphureus 93-53]
MNHSKDASEAEVVDPLARYPRRVRHITAVQVRNLTPFPVRDAFASALKQSSEQPQFTPQGHLSDDLDLTIGRKRARRMSSSSSIHIVYHRPGTEEVHRDLDGPNGIGTRRRTTSRTSVSSIHPPSAASGLHSSRRFSVAGAAPTVRPSHRPRTVSGASSSSRTGLFSAVDQHDSALSGISHIPNLLQDVSQRGLEKVLQSRLVETFLTITLPSIPSESDTPLKETAEIDGASAEGGYSKAASQAKQEKASTSTHKPESPRTSNRRITNGTTSPKTSSSRLSASTNRTAVSSSRSSSFDVNIKSASSSSLANKPAKSSTSPSGSKQRPPVPSPLTSPTLTTFKTAHSRHSTPPSTPSSPRPNKATLNDGPCVPSFISPIHWPSTNPAFQLDARSRGEFAPGADLSGSKMRVEVWGHVKRGLGWSSSGDRDLKGKGKERERSEQDGLEWKLLQGWDVDLGDLVPLSKELATYPSHLPSNSLLVTLYPPGRTYYLPTPDATPPSPLPPYDAGYSSDPESEARKTSAADETILPSERIWTSEKLSDQPEVEDSEQKEYGSLRRKGKRKTASWQELLRLINLQTCILDNERSLSDIVHKIDKLVTQPGAGLVRREVSEREAWIGQLHSEAADLNAQSDKLRERLAARRADLQKRRELLALARELNENASQLEFEQEEELINERGRLSTLRDQIGPMRSLLITTLSFIFPIELVSPPDLLFTILDVPLPIPLGPNDPAPPLSLSSHKEVTEDAVATALGYAAQVVQMLAAYIGKGLVYPVTCVGSRSLIKDGISAMVGPRMFPLFSKGVDTYRFEYGVFLLNKDIELLMSERNLRALDMRHTLPNLKNLLLTLIDNNESVELPSHRFPLASSESISSLQSPILTASSLPAPSDIATPTVDAKPDGLPAVVTNVSADEHGAESPPQSGSTTPTRAHPDSGSSTRKSRAFLDLAPLTGFLRARYPSSSRPMVRSVPESPEGSQEDSSTPTTRTSTDASDEGTSEAGPAESEDDRRTIRGHGEGAEEGKIGLEAHGNGHAAHGEENGTGEKAEESVHDRATPAVLVNGTH